MLRKLLASALLATTILAGAAHADPIATSGVVLVQAAPTVTASSPYVSGYGFGGLQTLAVPANKGFIQNVSIDYASGAMTAQVDLVLLDAYPAASVASVVDFAAVSIVAADAPKIIGTIHVADCTATSATTANCQAVSQGYAHKVPAQTLWVVPVIRGTPTFGTAADVTFKYYFVQ